jgi:hypothetical protein
MLKNWSLGLGARLLKQKLKLSSTLLPESHFVVLLKSDLQQTRFSINLASLLKKARA